VSFVICEVRDVLSDAKVVPTLSVVEIERAREFYEKKLDLKVIGSGTDGIFFECGKGTILYIYKRGSPKADHTVAGFIATDIEMEMQHFPTHPILPFDLGFVVTDIEAEMQSLREKGVVFEEYDIPELKTVNGIATFSGGEKSAWFKDTEDNILALHQQAT
jgi:catechol 2,3-dioxygenase-like lactoylglutathione lyase family enzyme